MGSRKKAKKKPAKKRRAAPHPGSDVASRQLAGPTPASAPASLSSPKVLKSSQQAAEVYARAFKATASGPSNARKASKPSLARSLPAAEAQVLSSVARQLSSSLPAAASGAQQDAVVLYGSGAKPLNPLVQSARVSRRLSMDAAADAQRPPSASLESASARRAPSAVEEATAASTGPRSSSLTGLASSHLQLGITGVKDRPQEGGGW